MVLQKLFLKDQLEHSHPANPSPGLSHAAMRGCGQGLSPWQDAQGTRHVTNQAEAISKVQVDFG